MFDDDKDYWENNKSFKKSNGVVKSMKQLRESRMENKMEKSIIDMLKDGKCKLVTKTTQICLLPQSDKSHSKELDVLHYIAFTLKSTDEEFNFFSSADSMEKETIYYSFLSTASEASMNQMEWTDKGTGSVNIDAYPEEVQTTINNGLNASRNIFGKADSANCVFVSFEEISDYVSIDFQENTLKAKKEINDLIKKFSTGDGLVDLGSFVDRYWFKKHLLIQGEKGVGKTFTVDQKLNEHDVDYRFVAGHEGIESIDLLGYYIKDEKGNLVWLDGVLSEVFRIAQDKPCALFIDEILRIPSRELNILVGALTPSSKGTYRIRTNRIVDVIDGVGTTELIEVKMENLWCIGTTNVGAGYQVDEIDDALSDRFRVVVKETSNAELESILLNCATKNKISHSVVSNMITFYSQMKDFVTSGELEKSVNLRHLCEVLEYSQDDTEIKSYMMDLINTWCSSDTNGNPNKSEKEIITKMLKRIFK